MIGKIEELVPYIFNLDKDKKYEIKEFKEKRSLDANAYMWQLCQKLAEKIKITKEDVYKEAILKVGKFETIPIRIDALEKFMSAWIDKHIGRICETKSSKLDGYINVLAYYGSSDYDTVEMSRLIDYIVEECKEQGIETMTPNELESLKNSWRNK